MKKLIFAGVAVVLCFSGTVLQAQQEDSHPFGTNPTGATKAPPSSAQSTPSPFGALKLQYQDDLKTALTPIQDRYKTALQALMKTLTQNGDLDAALAVRTELQGVGNVTALAKGAPAQLGALKDHYETDIQAATKPIQDRYESALKTLMKTLTQNGNLEGAVAVEQELKTVGGEQTSAASKVAGFADTVWETPHDKGSKDFSRITFKSDGIWTEAYKSNPLRGHWKATQDSSVVEVHISNGDVIHFKISDDGASCTRQEAACTWQRKPQTEGNPQ